MEDLKHDIPSARILLYDHLTTDERASEALPLSDSDSGVAPDSHSTTQEAVADYEIEDWASRFLNVLQECRSLETVRYLMRVLQRHMFKKLLATSASGDIHLS